MPSKQKGINQQQIALRADVPSNYSIRNSEYYYPPNCMAHK